MSRDLDILVESEVFRNKEIIWDNDDFKVKVGGKLFKLPNYSTDVEDAFLVLEELRESTMLYYNYMYLGGKHRLDNRCDEDGYWHASHENFCAAICLSALNSIKVDKELIRDALFSYNFFYGFI